MVKGDHLNDKKKRHFVEENSFEILQCISISSKCNILSSNFQPRNISQHAITVPNQSPHRGGVHREDEDHPRDRRRPQLWRQQQQWDHHEGVRVVQEIRIIRRDGPHRLADDEKSPARHGKDISTIKDSPLL